MNTNILLLLLLLLLIIIYFTNKNIYGGMINCNFENLPLCDYNNIKIECYPNINDNLFDIMKNFIKGYIDINGKFKKLNINNNKISYICPINKNIINEYKKFKNKIENIVINFIKYNNIFIDNIPWKSIYSAFLLIKSYNENQNKIDKKFKNIGSNIYNYIYDTTENNIIKILTDTNNNKNFFKLKNIILNINNILNKKNINNNFLGGKINEEEFNKIKMIIQNDRYYFKFIDIKNIQIEKFETKNDLLLYLSNIKTNKEYINKKYYRQVLEYYYIQYIIVISVLAILSIFNNLFLRMMITADEQANHYQIFEILAILYPVGLFIPKLNHRIQRYRIYLNNKDQLIKYFSDKNIFFKDLK